MADAAKAVMGAIDFDPWSSPEINKLVMAAKFYDREKLDLDTVLAKEWDVPGEKEFSLLQLMERNGRDAWQTKHYANTAKAGLIRRCCGFPTMKA